jgi:Flp pilus assembly protein TadG
MRQARDPHARRARGAVALEFALVAPVLFMLIFGVVGLYVLMVQDVLLESSVRKLAREIQYQQPASSANASTLMARVQSGLKSRLGARLQSTECVYLPAGGANPGLQSGCAGAQPGDLLVFTVTIRPTVMFVELPARFAFRRVLALRSRA